MIQPMFDMAISSPWGMANIMLMRERAADMLAESQSMSEVSSWNAFWNLSRPKAVPRGDDWLRRSSRM
jgi:hypothetical protein